MGQINSWLDSIKQAKPDLNDFITNAHSYFSDSGFNATDFEKRVDQELAAFENEIKEALKTTDNAED